MRGTFSPVLFLAVCLVRAIVDIIGVIEIMYRYCYDTNLRHGSPKFSISVMRDVRPGHSSSKLSFMHAGHTSSISTKNVNMRLFS